VPTVTLTNAADQDANSESVSELVDLDAALTRALRGNPSNVNAHLVVLERDIRIGQTLTRLHSYFLPLDAHGRVRFKPLAEFLRDQIVDYAIPRRTIEEAKGQVALTGSVAPLSKLHERAKGLFTHLATTGEGGELLLFAMAEAVLGLTQLICKMSLKTSSSVHYHGSDGVYADVRCDGGLNLYWGESKVHANASDAIRECLASLAPFVIEPDGADARRTQDILLVNEFANFNDQSMVEGLKRFLDSNNVASLLTRHCGIALAAFDGSSYPVNGATVTMDMLEKALRVELTGWQNAVGRRIAEEKLENFDVHFICVPMPSAEEFRRYFLQLLGVN
jgi:hypothetical protein